MGKLGEFDFSQFKRYLANLKGAKKTWPVFLDGCIRELANRQLAKVVQRTPVKDGKLRRSWVVGEIKYLSNGVEIEVYNPVEYAPYVEYGHRTPDHKGWVEGRFMMTISEQELERELPAIIEKRLKKFIYDHLG